MSGGRDFGGWELTSLLYWGHRHLRVKRPVGITISTYDGFQKVKFQKYSVKFKKLYYNYKIIVKL